MVIRSTKQERDNYWRDPSVSHSFLKEFFQWLDPSKDAELQEAKYGEEKKHNRLGGAQHCLLMRPDDFKHEFYVMVDEMPGDKSGAIINYAFEMALQEDRFISQDITHYQHLILQGCRPGNAIPDGYGGSWDDARKVKSILYEKDVLSEKVASYWRALCNSQGLIRITPKELEQLEDTCDRMKKHALGKIFDDATYDQDGVVCYFEWPIFFDENTGHKNAAGYTFDSKGMLDICIVNNGKKDFIIDNLIIRPNHYKVIDLKSTTESPGNGSLFIKKYRVDRQVMWYTHLVKSKYPMMMADEPGVLMISSIPNSEPVLYSLSLLDAQVAANGLDNKGMMLPFPLDEKVFLEYPLGYTHGLNSLIQKYQYYYANAITELREVVVMKNKSHLTTKLWNVNGQ